MKAFGGTCPMCCGDLDSWAYFETGAILCRFCACNIQGGRQSGAGLTMAAGTLTPPALVRGSGPAPARSPVAVPVGSAWPGR